MEIIQLQIHDFFYQNSFCLTVEQPKRHTDQEVWDVRLYLHVVKDFKKRERHSTSDNHLIHFVQQILNQQYLVWDLCTAKHTHTSSAAMDNWMCRNRSNRHTKKFRALINGSLGE